MDDKKLRPVNQVSDDVKNTTIQKLQNVLPEVFTENANVEYRFNWNGKKRSIKLPQVPTVATLKSNSNKSKNFDDTNDLYIEGDNLEVLKILQKSYLDKVTIVYLDSPYNTGKDNGRYHTDWLNMMYPGLKLARNLLTEYGTVFISVDGPELDNLKKIADKIFGEKNFLTQVIWERAYLPVNLKKKNFSEGHDYILVYGKDASVIKSYGLNQLINVQNQIITHVGVGMKRPMVRLEGQLLKRIFTKLLHIR